MKGFASDSSSGTVSPAACRRKRSTPFTASTRLATSRESRRRVPDRMVDDLARTGDMFLRPNTYGAGTGVTYNPERLKFVWDLLLGDRPACASGSTRCWSTWPPTREALRPGDRVHQAGLPSHRRAANHRCIGRRGCLSLARPRLRVGRRARSGPNAHDHVSHVQRRSRTFQAAGGKRMLAERMEAAIASGRHPVPRKSGSAHAMVQPGCIATVAVRAWPTWTPRTRNN